MLKELDDMPPDQVRAELRDSLTAFYEKILKKVGAEGRPVGRALPRKFESEKVPVPVSVPSVTEDAEEGHSEGKAPPPPPPAAAQAAPDGTAARGSPTPPTPPPKPAPAAKGGKARKGPA